MKKQYIFDLIEAGENSGVEFKLDNIRPEQLAREAVGLANLQGGLILLGVSEAGEIVGLTRSNPEEWVMDTVFGRYIHPAIIPYYQEVPLGEDKRVAVISVAVGTAKPYVLRHADREDIYLRVGSTTRRATREQVLRLFGPGGLLHGETLPVSGTSLKNLDRARLENYLQDILDEPQSLVSDAEWSERLHGLGFLTTDALGREVCTIAGLSLFGVVPRRFLPQAGLRVMAFAVADKQYQALLDVVLDGPMLGRWSIEKGRAMSNIDEGLVEKFVRTIEPFIAVESNEVDRSFRREKVWLYPLEAIRETVLNALVHRDWTRPVDIEVTRYADRLEIISPGALPNTMTIEKMKAGRRTPRNPIVLKVMRDYGYVDARGMGVRTKVIPLTRQFTGIDPDFEAGDDYFKTTIMARPALDSSEQFVPEKQKESNKYQYQGQNVPESVLKDVPQKALVQQVLSLIKENPRITYNQLAQRTGRHRKTIQRHIQILKDKGLLRRKGGARGGYWEVDVPCE